MFDKLKESLNKDKEKYTGNLIEDIKIVGNEFKKTKKEISKIIKDGKKEISETIKDFNKKEIIDDDKIIDLSYTDKKEFESHKKIRTRAQEFLLKDEEILFETVKTDYIIKFIKSYFITNKRILCIIPQLKDKIIVESVYYDNISSVMFTEGEKNISYLVISYKGRQQANMDYRMANVFKTLIDVRVSKFDDYTINLYSCIAKEVYTIINSYLYK